MFGYIPLWLDMYLSRRGGVGTDPAAVGGPGTVLTGVHSTASTTVRASCSRPNSIPPPSCRSISGDAIPRWRPVLWRAGTTVPNLLCRPREITIAETQSHPRGANAKCFRLGALVFAIHLSVPHHSTVSQASPKPTSVNQGETVSENGCLFRAAKRTPQVGTHPLAGLSSGLP